MTQRNIATCIILSIVTCGIYGIYWIYCIASDIYGLRNDAVPTTPGITVLLFFVTCGIYPIYVYYKWGKALYDVNQAQGIIKEDQSTIFLILSIFGLSIINQAMIQDNLNKLAES